MRSAQGALSDQDLSSKHWQTRSHLPRHPQRQAFLMHHVTYERCFVVLSLCTFVSRKSLVMRLVFDRFILVVFALWSLCSLNRQVESCTPDPHCAAVHSGIVVLAAYSDWCLHMIESLTVDLTWFAFHRECISDIHVDMHLFWLECDGVLCFETRTGGLCWGNAFLDCTFYFSFGTIIWERACSSSISAPRA